MKTNQADHRVTIMCRVLELSTSGYYAWLRRGPSPHAQKDAELSEKIRTAFAESRGTYGVPRIHAELADDGIQVGRKRIARLMKAERLGGRQPTPQAATDDGT